MIGLSTFKKIILAFSLPLLFSASTQAADAFAVTVKSVSGDFTETGYAVAEIEARFTKNGQPVDGVAVFWDVISVDNRSEALSVVAKNQKQGLAWERPIPASLGETAEQYRLVTDALGKATVKLTDIVGERSVIVAATATHEGVQYKDEGVIIFGKGPLSIFTAPLPEPVTWLELYEICNGEPYPSDPADWRTGIGFVGENKMPSLKQIQSVSMPSKYNRSPAAFAAAVAAGWPTDKRYWNSRVVMKNRAGHMDILKGTQHGSGGNDVNAKEYGVCIK